MNTASSICRSPAPESPTWTTFTQRLLQTRASVVGEQARRAEFRDQVWSRLGEARLGVVPEVVEPGEFFGDAGGEVGLFELRGEDAPGVGFDFEVAAGGVLAEGGEGEGDLFLGGFEEAEFLEVDGDVEVDAPLAAGVGGLGGEGEGEVFVEEIFAGAADDGLMEVSIFGELRELVDGSFSRLRGGGLEEVEIHAEGG